MILNRPLTEEDKKSSQKNTLIFNSINGFSYMCLGETLIILLAVKMTMPDTLITILGSMQHIGFILLPLGVWRAAKVGAAQCQADFWICRNIAAILAAVAAVISPYYPVFSWILLLLTSFTFYGCRAAGVVLCQPLGGEITSDHDRAQFIGKCGTAFYLFGVISLLLISFALTIHDSIYLLCGVIILGAALGITASGFVRRIKETGELRKSASEKLLPKLKENLQDQDIIRQLFAGFWATFSVVTILPIAILFIKKGYGFSNTKSLFFSSMMFIACFTVSYLTGKFAAKKGPRLLLICGISAHIATAFCWILAPYSGAWATIPLSLILFFLFGSAIVMCDNALHGYFLMTIPKNKQVLTAVLINILRGVCAGAGGMLLASGLLKLSQYLVKFVLPYVQKVFPSATEQITIYKLYFLMLLPFLIVGFCQILKLKTVITTFKEKYGDDAVKEAVRPQNNKV